jgi:hypothetical protein
MSYNTNEEALITIENINQHPFLQEVFKSVFPDNSLIDIFIAVKANLMDSKLRSKLILICPPMYKIGDTVFLHGDDTREVVYIGDESMQQAIELFDMTTEMKTGDSYQIFVSGVSYFKRATSLECCQVVKFLESL